MLAFKTAYRGRGVRPERGRTARLPADGARLRRAHRPRAAAAAQPPGRPGTAAPRPGQGRIPVRGRRGRGLRRSCPGWAGVRLGQVLTAWETGPPREEVGLEPFAPPDYLAGWTARAERVNGAPPRSCSGGSPLPYLALGVFVVGHVWRWRYDQFGWTSRSTQLQERRLLKWGGPLFHYGTFAAIAGHVIGILIPETLDPGPSASPRAPTAGSPPPPARSPRSWSSAACVVLAGRRLLVPRVRATTCPDRLGDADPAAGHHPHRHRPHHLRQPVRPRLRLPRPPSRPGSAACSPSRPDTGAIAPRRSSTSCTPPRPG